MKHKSPFLKESSTGNIIKRSPTIYQQDLLKRFDEAINKLKKTIIKNK